ncbi:MAG: hypothetical protein AAF532_10000 [Planctomycetota bacterium]
MTRLQQVTSSLRRGILIGAGLGGLLGAANWAVRGPDGRPPLQYALDWLVGGAALGVIAGGVRAVGEAGPKKRPPEDQPGPPPTD